ncbi:inner membrane transport protein YnfM [Clostridium tepidiprofundi DSM 19306]|uniref:Inner membrane transport protein YnfM n=1 Tax=Clostridium tepidiprofundi DSM 19306 TaxID=1121338 RepID=A0A151B2Z0_9CLOT|nr:MFS transporter [Clostridium tepidiprofundi]KYH34284.1 inner membrane transport protein YnfM [Clostridium tepidiprofundi DSM 19306]
MKDKRKMLLVLGLMAFLANGDNYAAAPLLINISKDLNITVSTAALSVTAYMLSFGVFTLLFGPLSDRFGKVKIINIAAMGTAIFSTLGAFAFNLPSLIFFRAMNGAFGAGIFPVTMALVGQSFDNENRQKALGKVMGLMFLGGATATAIGGALAYAGSWRLVYLVYGIGELVLAIVMLKILERDKPVVERLSFISAYKGAFANYRFMRLVMTIFFVGFSVFGSFTYSGKLLQEITGYNILVVGLILSIFGIGTVIGGRIAPKAKMILKHGFLVSAGVIGSISLFILSTYENIWILVFGFLGFGIAFIFLQSTLIATAQEKLPKMKGTAMSLASFNMFVGGAVGTSINGIVMKNYGVSRIFYNASFVLLGVGLLAAIFVARFEI